MGLKIPKAFYSIENREITVEEAGENEIKTDLFCPSKCCRKPLVYVDSHKRNYGDKVTLVRAYFRLANNFTHDENCKYNTDGIVKIIARDSDGVLKSINNGKYEFRLNLISSSLKNIRKEQNDTDGSNSHQNNDRNQKNKEYINKGKLNSYLSTMNKILELKSQVEENKELASLIKLKLGAKTISWNNFYYSFDDYIKCFNYINRNPVKHPICIEGKIKDIQEPTKDFKYHSLILTRPWIEEEDKDGFKKIPSVTAVIFNESVLDYIQREKEKGNEYIAFYSFINVNEKTFEKFRYLNIRGSIYHKKQIHLFSL